MNSSTHISSTTVTPTKTKNFVDLLQNSCKFHGTNSLRFLRYSSSISLISYNRAYSYDGNGSSKNGNKTQKQNQLKPIKAMVDNNKKDGRFSGLGFTKEDKSNQIGDNGGNTTMEKIVEKLKRYGFVDDDDKEEIVQERNLKKESMEDIEGNISKTRVSKTRDEFSKDSSFRSNGEVKFPWEKVRYEEDKEMEEEWTAKKESRYSLAKSILPESELNRLRNLMFRTKSKMRIKGAGVTQAVVDAIQEKWKSSEIVRLKIEGDNALNMRKMHEILERKTGGLVIWRSGTAISLYKYKGGNTSEKLNKQVHKRSEAAPSLLPTRTSRVEHNVQQVHLPQEVEHNVQQVHLPQEEKEMTTVEINDQAQVEYEDEIDELLDGLGPRYTDWQGAKPLPIDADLLPGIVPGYESPFRVVPYGVRTTIGHKEATALRRLANVLPPHFALGRSRHLQGLATAMVKLWQKSSIVKIALKRGIQLTTSERMAEDIKRLTGGMLLSRSKDFLVFYRGKSFLTEEVAKALQEKERLAVTLQDDEEQARLRASSALVNPSTKPNQTLVVSAGTLGETLDASGKWGKNLEEDDNIEEMKREAEKARHANIIRKLEKKLAFAERRLKKAERDLAKVEESLNPAEQRGDLESITEEERFMFRKLGLKMKAFLLLGRRGVFDGTVENMHLHWKYRELIKILVKVRNYENAKKLALALEAESGGVLVSVDKVSKGYAIIVYRGKDYTRPSTLRPKNLLTKRKALARSVELQRREGLMKHIGAVKARSEKLRAEIKQMELVGDKGDETLYSKLDETYSSDDDETEETDEEDVEDGEEGETWVHGSLPDDENWDSDESDIDFGDDLESITTPEEASDLQSEGLLSATVDN